MLEITATLFLVGMITGAFYSMPVAGPISILVVSYALRGERKFCSSSAFGASLIEGTYVFVMVYGIAALYDLYRPVLPYLLLAGAIFLIFLGFKIRKQNLDLNTLETGIQVSKTRSRWGGLITGILVNLSNPTLLINWFIASFITLTFVASLGMNTGGLDVIINDNMNSISEMDGTEIQTLQKTRSGVDDPDRSGNAGKVTPLIMSLVFAFGVGTGEYTWFRFLTFMIIRHRDRIKTAYLNKLLLFLAIVLIAIGSYLGFRAVNLLIG
jgi:threonine/homoserine/homoserine lactone efflux protein